MANLQPINKNASDVFFKLISGLEKTGAHNIFDSHNYLPERNGGIMSVHVECIGKNHYSVAHYFEQNGDLMSNPEVTFWICEGKVYPYSFTQHSFGVYQVSVCFGDDGWPKSARRDMQRDQAEFVDFWMVNIKDQQDI